MIKKKSFLVTFTLMCILAVGIIFFTSCGKKTESKNASETQVIKIGAILPLTGNIAYFGEYEKNALEVAMSRIKNKINGKLIEVVYEDSENNPQKAVSAINKLINNDKVVAVVTQMTNVSYAIAPIAQKNKIILLTLAMDPKVSAIGDYIFRIYESITDESKRLAEYFIKEELNVKRIDEK